NDLALSEEHAEEIGRKFKDLKTADNLNELINKKYHELVEQLSGDNEFNPEKFLNVYSGIVQSKGIDIYPTQLADQLNTMNQNDKRSSKKYNSSCQKKQKVATFPVYFDGCQPDLILNQFHRNFKFVFKMDTNVSNKHKCTATIKIKDKKTGKINVHNFQGEGLSKKDARNDCANKALTTFYPNSYQLPKKKIENEEPKLETDPRIKNLNRINELRLRISKLVTSKTILVKAPYQILQELSSKISKTAKLIEDRNKILEKRFIFEIENLKDESIVSLDDNVPSTKKAYGYGEYR
ncbi:unnamed protein product, partial [Brachionus calyciflorus]